MTEYISKQVQIRRPDAAIYAVISDFNNFTPILADKVEGWAVEDDSCTFKVKGFTLRLRMVEKEPNKTVKVAGDDGSPFPFTFWVQLAGQAPDDTRMRIVLRVELNMMMKMMVGSKLQEAVDQIADQIAASFNNAPL
ncbi:MAG: polyketide cyclase [Rikenellaceae bacterium]|nr:polyketide cyclase [Rikenellaceae bacterium]